MAEDKFHVQESLETTTATSCVQQQQQQHQRVVTKSSCYSFINQHCSYNHDALPNVVIENGNLELRKETNASSEEAAIHKACWNLLDDGVDNGTKRSWAHTHVFGKTVFLPLSTAGSEPSPSKPMNSLETKDCQDGDDNDDDAIPGPLPLMRSCSSLFISVLTSTDDNDLERNDQWSTTSDENEDDEDDGDDDAFAPDEPLKAKPSSTKATTGDSNFPTEKDVCFGLINHPGTKHWRWIVDSVAVQMHHCKWSGQSFQNVMRRMEGYRFWTCVDSASKTRKDQKWRTATHEEILERTKQRFRDCRKIATESAAVKRPRGRPPNNKQKNIAVNASIFNHATPVNLASDSPSPQLSKKLNKAIEACTEAFGEAQTFESTQINHLNKKMKFSSSLEQPSHDLLGFPVGAGKALETKHLELLQSPEYLHSRLKQHKLAEAQLHLFNFVRCLTEYEHLCMVSTVDNED